MRFPKEREGPAGSHHAQREEKFVRTVLGTAQYAMQLTRTMLRGGAFRAPSSGDAHCGAEGAMTVDDP